MSFISVEYILFFCVVLPLYFALPYRFRWAHLLLASYFFYAYSNGWYTLVIIFSTLADYYLARKISATEDQQRRRRYLYISMSLNLGVLFIFKYFNFFNNSLAGVFGALNVPYGIQAINVILPVGISFYTFQEMSYVIDVYRGVLKPERNVGIFSTFVIFFPQLVAGPIERAGSLIAQFHRRFDFSHARTVEGLRLILWGFFKKVVIADRLAIYVNAVYNNTQDHTGLTLIVATFFFAFQIYCDFSGYTDIAIGTAKIMGFNLMLNFRQPYFSRSVREFWRRWHISLSSWFRDYLYIPLGGNRAGYNRMLLNLMIVFVVSGLWHGASWTFVIWGTLHGLYVVAETILAGRAAAVKNAAPPRSMLLSIAQWTLTFTLVCFAWIFFRANTFEDALYVMTHLFVFPEGFFTGITDPFASEMTGAFGSTNRFQLLLSFALIGLLMGVDYLDARWGLNRVLNARPKPVRWLVYYTATGFVLLLGIWGAQEFIYFQF